SRRLSAAAPAEPHFLSASVDDDDPRRIDNQFPECVERASSEGVDEEQPLRRGDLDEAEPRMVGVLADELGVETDLRTSGQVLTAGDELLSGADDLFVRLLSLRTALLLTHGLTSCFVGYLSLADAPTPRIANSPR